MPDEVEVKCEQCGGQELLFLCGPDRVAIVCKTCWYTDHKLLTPELKQVIQKKMSPVDPFMKQ
jgi:hypothetical protein